ncbi:hypothetical protein JAAARDRAFT_616720 [Jaapia argillacea MUCL 33604]|uniref:BTB domain-containing protein n=1 Tax=Jaapia argillacea MUCL 33604 TaxID=933084 RepID=A0A067PF97_9AGAM|nr:hypothetical protein JAAARDRAFT_616720 [Jaapia argillacea MUCL 33604]
MTTFSEEPGLVRSDDLWYEDGSVGLRAGMTLFRVHTSILSRHSEVLKAIFSQALETNSEMYEGCPLVEVTDSENDWEHFLKTIYIWPYFMPMFKEPFDVVAAVARLSTKYACSDLRYRATLHLASVFPFSPTNWAIRDKTRLIPPFEGELAAYLKLAFECDLKIILPALYYSACQGPLADALKAFDSVRHSTNLDVSPAFLLGRDRLRYAENQSASAYLLQRNPTFWCVLGCDVEEGFLRDRAEALVRSTASASAEQKTYAQCCIRHHHPVEGHHSKCYWYCTFIEQSIEASRNSVWEKLPEFFGLSDWETLKKEADV